MVVDVWTVEVDLVDDWLLSLDQKSSEQVVAALELLAERGPSLVDRSSIQWSARGTRT